MPKRTPTGPDDTKKSRCGGRKGNYEYLNARTHRKLFACAIREWSRRASPKLSRRRTRTMGGEPLGGNRASTPRAFRGAPRRGDRLRNPEALRTRRRRTGRVTLGDLVGSSKAFDGLVEEAP